jgi:hypothetical protein
MNIPLGLEFRRDDCIIEYCIENSILIKQSYLLIHKLIIRSTIFCTSRFTTNTHPINYFTELYDLFSIKSPCNIMRNYGRQWIKKLGILYVATDQFNFVSKRKPYIKVGFLLRLM